MTQKSVKADGAAAAAMTPESVKAAADRIAAMPATASRGWPAIRSTCR